MCFVLCDQATELCLAGVALVEIVSAFYRLLREKRISASQYRQLKTLLLADISDAAISDLTPEVLHHAIVSLEGNRLRGMDAHHIGSALALEEDLFVTADVKQHAAALQVRLQARQV